MIGAILGSSIKVETLDGEMDLEIKPGTQDGDKILLEKAGVWAHEPPDNYDPTELRGDHLITVQVDLPKQGELSQHQMEILREWAKLEEQNRDRFYP